MRLTAYLNGTRVGWATPIGSTASTHILKPGIKGLDRSDLSEHLTMRAAALLGLHVAESRIASFEDQTAIVVTRFDRVPGMDGTFERLHQEDFAQAAGVHPAVKYQNQGGPGIATIGQLMREHLGRDADRDVMRFFEATLFNWASLSTDAHSKNYAILYGHSRIDRARLAPLYDLGTALPFPEINGPKVRLAMSFSKHYRASEIESRHIVREAESVGLGSDWVAARARQIVEGLPGAFSSAVSEARLEGDDAVFARRLVDAAAGRSASLLKELNRAERS